MDFAVGTVVFNLLIVSRLRNSSEVFLASEIRVISSLGNNLSPQININRYLSLSTNPECSDRTCQLDKQACVGRGM